jgi:hypothetical protein
MASVPGLAREKIFFVPIFFPDKPCYIRKKKYTYEVVKIVYDYENN